MTPSRTRTSPTRALRPAAPTGVERFFDRDEVIVSKTDPGGRITYANHVFLRVSGYHEHEILGRPHNLVRHPRMPRGVFSLLWETVARGDEIFAYVVNLARNGDHYWVFAHVTPTFGPDGEIVGYHSNRRVPTRRAIREVEPLYDAMCEIEAREGSPRDAADASRRFLLEELGRRGVAYDALMFALAERGASDARAPEVRVR